MLIPRPLPLDRDGIEPEDEEANILDMGRLDPCRLAGGRAISKDCPRMSALGEVNGEATIVNASPLTWYVLPTSGKGIEPWSCEDDFAFRRGARFFDVSTGRPSALSMVGFELKVDARIDDLTSGETTVNFSRTDAGTCSVV